MIRFIPLLNKAYTCIHTYNSLALFLQGADGGEQVHRVDVRQRDNGDAPRPSGRRAAPLHVRLFLLVLRRDGRRVRRPGVRVQRPGTTDTGEGVRGLQHVPVCLRTDWQWKELQVRRCVWVPLSLIICRGYPIPGIIRAPESRWE